MELKSGQPQKKLISLLSCDDAPCAVQARWYFSELCSDDIDIDFFEMGDDAEIHCYGDVLSWCMSVLEHSPSARLMLREACDKDWKITIEDLRGGEYCIDVEQKLLILDNNSLVPSALGRSGYFRNMTIVTLTKALRDIWQEKRHGGFDEHYSPEYILLMERVRAADLDVMSVMMAWELRSEEFSEIWRHMIGSEVGDMAMAFSGYLERDPSSAYSGLALRAAFKQWFRDEKRLHSCDHDTLEYLDDVLALTNDTASTFGKKRPGRMNIEVLSCLPDKTAYLQGMGGEILADPIYSSVDDPINQTHLFHIMYDLEAIVVENVAFRDASLARKIFPIE
ncbi:MAG: DUF6782 family putative metallopeptidase [Alphaproteobacteria bacterium]